MTTKLNENSVKTHIEIEGVILTPEVIKSLKGWQEHDNEQLDYMVNALADAVCFIGSNIYMFHEHQDEERKKAFEIISTLCFVRDHVKELAKP